MGTMFIALAGLFGLAMVKGQARQKEEKRFREAFDRRINQSNQRMFEDIQRKVTREHVDSLPKLPPASERFDNVYGPPPKF